MKSQLTGDFNAEVLFQNSKWSIEKYLNPKTSKNSLCVVRDECFTDFAVIYENKSIAFDFPERMPNYIITKCKRFAQSL